MARAIYVTACALGALVLATVATGAASETGVTSTQVVIGGTVPLSGNASAYQSVAKGAAAYFRYVNAHGGVNKRKIKYIYKDDGYNPANTIEKTRELVQQDKVFAIFNSLGTEHNLAIRGYLNALRIPQLFVASGATTFGRDYKQFPWTNPKARIAVLYQNDDFGKDLLKGLQIGLGKKAKLIVAKQSYDVTDSNVKPQISKLKSKKANTLMLFSTPQATIGAYFAAYSIKWRPKVYVNAVSSASNILGLATAGSSKKETEGSVSIVFLKDPTDPRWRKDPGSKLYRSIMKKFKGGNPNDVYAVYGMSAAHTFVAALRKAGKNPTRGSIMRAATSLNVKNDPFLLPGMAVHTSKTDHFPLDQAKLQRYHNGHWVSFGGLFRVR
jgi:branched-chain amino acid transport system substrate-binding protein